MAKRLPACFGDISERENKDKNTMRADMPEKSGIFFMLAETNLSDSQFSHVCVCCG